MKTIMTNSGRKNAISKRRTSRFFSAFKNPFTIISFILLLIESFTLIFALVWGFSSSLKDLNDYRENMFGFPTTIQLGNYIKVYKYLKWETWLPGGGTREYYFIELLRNSLLYATFPVIITVFSMMMVSYVCSKYDFKFNKVLETIVVVVLIFPGVSSLGSRIEFLKRLNLYDHYWALLEGSFVFADYNFLVWKGIFKGISNDYIDAAKIDGAGNYKILFQIVIPLVRVPLCIFLVQGFIGNWNSYNTALITMPSFPNLALVLRSLRENSTNEISWPMFQMAGAMMVAIPCIIIYIFIEPFMVGNLTSGGIKE